MLDLTALAKCGLLREGDVLAYHREFPHLRLVVEKDLLVKFFHWYIFDTFSFQAID